MTVLWPMVEMFKFPQKPEHLCRIISSRIDHQGIISADGDIERDTRVLPNISGILRLNRPLACVQIIAVCDSCGSVQHLILQEASNDKHLASNLGDSSVVSWYGKTGLHCPYVRHHVV